MPVQHFLWQQSKIQFPKVRQRKLLQEPDIKPSEAGALTGLSVGKGKKKPSGVILEVPNQYASWLAAKNRWFG